MDLKQHVGIHQNEVISRPQGETGMKTIEFTRDICHKLNGLSSLGRAGDCTGCRTHPDKCCVMEKLLPGPGLQTEG